MPATCVMLCARMAAVLTRPPSLPTSRLGWQDAERYGGSDGGRMTARFYRVLLCSSRFGVPDGLPVIRLRLALFLIQASTAEDAPLPNVAL